jgi:type I restriction enzyme S subunit
MRTRTSHAYDAGTALAVVVGIPDLLREAEHLYTELERAARMSDAVRPDIAEEHARIVRDILRARLPESAQIRVFGSCATGRARAYSDLDLAIDAGRRLTLDDCAILAEAFSDSDLPYQVDIVDWHAIDDRFRRIVAGRRASLAHCPRSGNSMHPGPGGGA